MRGGLVRDGVRADRPALRRVWQAAWRATYAPVVGEVGVDAIVRRFDASDFADMLPGRDERHPVEIRLVHVHVPAGGGETCSPRV